MVADLVAPISYSPRTGQHHYNLRTYKGAVPPATAKWHLLALLLLFLREHRGCIEARVGARSTHAIVVPSTRNPSGPHPLASLIGTRLDLPWLSASVNPRYGSDEREFHADWFRPVVPTDDGPVHALILEDTWTTGARAQSLAHALKSHGAQSVATVVLGRHLDPNFGHARPILAAIGDAVFDTSRCVAEPESTGG